MIPEVCIGLLMTCYAQADANKIQAHASSLGYTCAYEIDIGDGYVNLMVGAPSLTKDGPTLCEARMLFDAELIEVKSFLDNLDCGLKQDEWVDLGKWMCVRGVSKPSDGTTFYFDSMRIGDSTSTMRDVEPPKEKPGFVAILKAFLFE